MRIRPDRGPWKAAVATRRQDPASDLPPRHPRSGIVKLVVLGALFAVLVMASMWVLGRYLQTGEVRLPDLEGRGYDEAAAELRTLGLEPRAYPEIDPRAAANAVVSQAPPAGQLVRPGRQVAVGVNGLAEARVAPTLVGLRESDAVARAEAVGVAVESVVYVGSDRPPGAVVRQEPPAGTALAPGQSLALTVSRGVAEGPIVLPDLAGRPIDEAEAELAALGVRQVERVAAELSFDRPLSVTDQRPAAGTSVLPSTPVTLVYALEGARVVQVPDVAGLPLWRAQLALRAAQLQVGAVRRVEDATLPEGVVEAVPSGYTVAGSPIALTVNGAPTPADFGIGGDDRLRPFGDEPSRDPLEDDRLEAASTPEEVVPAPGTSRVEADGARVIPFRFDPATVGVASLTREPYRLTVVLSDGEGERTVLDRDLAAGEGVEISVRVVGDEPLLQTFINDSFFQAWRP